VAHVSLITLGVDDLARSEAYYTALGWRRSDASVPDVVTFLTGGTVALSLFPRPDLAADAGIDAGDMDGRARVALASNVASTDEVDRIVADAEAAGGTVVKRPERAEWGGYSGYVADPDGHLWEVAHNPHFPLDADGRITI
jgi:uncharacterized protein